MASPSTTIVLEPEKVTVTTVDEQGVKSVKNSNIETIQQIFMKEQALETPLLPSQWGIVKYYRKNHYEGYVMTTPPTERRITFDFYSGNNLPTEITIPVPPMLWLFEVMTDANGNKKLTHSMTYVLKHELLSLKDPVLHAPYCNIGVNHGICWGNRVPEAPTAKSLQNIPARFFSQPFNFDLSGNRVKEFLWEHPNGNEERTDVAVYHMIKLANELAAAKEAGETYSYPFESLKAAGNLDVNAVIKSYLPGLFR